MKRDAFVTQILYGEDHSIGAELLRAQLALLAHWHKVGLEMYLFPYRTGVRKRYRLKAPVIAVGNLSSGGTGKTPMTVLIAGHLQRLGKRVVVLSRGHGGSGEAQSTPRVVSDGEDILLSPAEAGDEPVLLAKLLPGVPIIICRDRRKSGQFAVDNFKPDVIVCDDALQYWQLHRDLDIVLLDSRQPFDNGYVLPRGLLREPPSHLARAQVIVLTRANCVSPEDLARTINEVQHLAPHSAVFTAIHAPIAWVRGGRETLPLNAFAGKRALVFSGIANSAGFVETVRQLEVEVAATIDFGDHHAYAPDDMERLAATAAENNCTLALTTEKDMVKVAPLMSKDTLPLYALRIGMAVRDEATFFDRIEASLTRK